jgi:hypothetical protein
MVEVGIENVCRNVPAGGEVVVGILDQAERGERGPDFGDCDTTIAKTQSITGFCAARTRHV